MQNEIEYLHNELFEIKFLNVSIEVSPLFMRFSFTCVHTKHCLNNQIKITHRINVYFAAHLITIKTIKLLLLMMM